MAEKKATKAAAEKKVAAPKKEAVKAEAAHSRRKGCGDHRGQTVVVAPVDALVSRPKKCRILSAAGKAGAHKEHAVTQETGFLHRLPVAFCPEKRPQVVDLKTCPSPGADCIRRKILSEIRHPALESHACKVFFYDIFIPGEGLF